MNNRMVTIVLTRYWQFETGLKRHAMGHLGRSAHVRLFGAAANFHPVLWKVATIWGTFLLFFWGLHDAFGFWFTAGLAAPVAFWLAMGTYIIPVAAIPSVVVEVRPGKVLAIHLEHDIPSDEEREILARAILERAWNLGFVQLEMRSALFGNERKAHRWHLALTRVMHEICPDAVVAIADRIPLNAVMSQRYLCTYDAARGRAHVVNGRVAAARITVSKIGSSCHTRQFQ